MGAGGAEAGAGRGGGGAGRGGCGRKAGKLPRPGYLTHTFLCEKG